MIAALLIGGAALAHATWNIAMKRAGTSGTPFIAATLLVGVIALAPFGVVSLATEPPAQDGWYVVALVAGSATLQLAYFLLLQRGYRLADVGVVYPVARGVGPLLSVVAAILLLGERPGPIALAGALLVVTGVVVIGLAGARRASLDAGRRVRGIRYGAAVGVVIAAYTLWDAAAVTLAGLAPVGYYWASMVVQLLVLGAIALRTPATAAETARAHPIAAVLVGVLSPLAYIAVLFAYQLAPVTIVAPAREVSVVLIALAGWMLFREPHPVRRILGSIVVIGGVALLALG
ncbi:MAG: DMT family transporter [Actinobacteria bacterium]|nr:DMT family transporter [Actinomycetota bacterium]MBU1609150.1 DMT family transporter [Actinomycetota bacterium]MBU2316753.1 DMT family transporter [Actinomycetota bacterium]MBU2384377.1 DMT family transporter [Actinomycetota bacterium]